MMTIILKTGPLQYVKDDISIDRVLDIPSGVHAWHFRVRKNTLRPVDYSSSNRGADVVEGGTNVIRNGTIKLCHRGLHASFKPYDAYGYVDGRYGSLVDVGGQLGIFRAQTESSSYGDKFCVARRRVVRLFDLARGLSDVEFNDRLDRLSDRASQKPGFRLVNAAARDILADEGLVVYRGVPVHIRLIGTPELRRFIDSLEDIGFSVPR